MSAVGKIEPESARNPMRKRKRNMVSEDQRKEIAERVVKFYNDEKMLHDKERGARLQRYAKYRMWQQGTNWPWPNASDAVIPDMLQDSLRVQDTLNNAVLSQSPAILSKATKPIDKDKQKTVDSLLEYQFFQENRGEDIIGELAESFTNDPSVTVFVPWVREKKKVCDVQIFDAVPPDADPQAWFMQTIKEAFPNANRMDTKNGWDWDVTEGEEEFEVCFYTNEADEIEMTVEREAIIYDGPRALVKDYDDVLFPARSKNLQPPGPANPGGAPYVVLQDFPLVAELASLQDSGYYDLLTNEELEKIKLSSSSVNVTSANDSQRQKDQLQGVTTQPGQPLDQNHKKLTRLMCFDTYDIDGDGIAEDVVFWVLLETKTTLRVRRLGDVSPGSPPRRPLFGGCFLPVGGRYAGMSLLEITEGIHDAIKVMVDQGINANDLAIASPGYYRPSGGMNPEVLTIEPFTLTPLQNPQQDVVFPQIGNAQAMGFSLNMISMLGMWQDKTTMVNDNSFGQVAPGSSSALRTIGGMAMLNGQGEARPERILRRFFSIVSDVYGHFHRLNNAYLPKGKVFRVIGAQPANADPYVKLDSRDKYAGEFDFTFAANAFNTSKQALQQALTATMQVLINPLNLQMGTVTAENVYNMEFDYVMAQGQPANRYTTPPNPAAAGPRILAEEAITEIMRNQFPIGAPLEPGGVQEHMQKLTEFAGTPEFGLLTEPQVDLFRQYLLKLQEMLAQAAQAQQLQAAAGEFAQNMNQGKPGAPVTNPAKPAAAPAPVSGPNELQDERLPGAGGGANGA